MSDIIFADGLIVKRREKAPDYVLCSLSVKVSEFIETLEKHQRDGWVNIDCLVSKAGKPYAKIDDFRPTQGQVGRDGMEDARNSLDRVARYEPDEKLGDFDDEIPF